MTFPEFNMPDKFIQFCHILFKNVSSCSFITGNAGIFRRKDAKIYVALKDQEPEESVLLRFWKNRTFLFHLPGTQSHSSSTSFQYPEFQTFPLGGMTHTGPSQIYICEGRCHAHLPGSIRYSGPGLGGIFKSTLGGMGLSFTLT